MNKRQRSNRSGLKLDPLRASNGSLAPTSATQLADVARASAASLGYNMMNHLEQGAQGPESNYDMYTR